MPTTPLIEMCENAPVELPTETETTMTEADDENSATNDEEEAVNIMMMLNGIGVTMV